MIKQDKLFPSDCALSKFYRESAVKAPPLAVCMKRRKNNLHYLSL